MIILNDRHIGVTRSAGTTPESQVQLREWLLKRFHEDVQQADHEDLIILGDLFDSHTVPYTDLFEVYYTLSNWCKKNKNNELILVPGNHDLFTDTSKLSSFQFLARLLLEDYRNVAYVREATETHDGIWIVPHMINQEAFEAELAKVQKCNFLLVHCNFDNKFAKQADHSLNMTREQIFNCPADKVVFAHEHNSRASGKAYVLGVQWPTSISDCLAEQDKHMHRISGNHIQPIKTFERKVGYREFDWRTDPAEIVGFQFVRIVGECLPEESAGMTEAVATIRKMSDAFVIGNAVQIKMQDEQGQQYTQSLESVQAFDLMAALRKILPAGDIEIIESLK